MAVTINFFQSGNSCERNTNVIKLKPETFQFEVVSRGKVLIVMVFIGGFNIRNKESRWYDSFNLTETDGKDCVRICERGLFNCYFMGKYIDKEEENKLRILIFDEDGKKIERKTFVLNTET
jgi:hypothetical protein